MKTKLTIKILLLAFILAGSSHAQFKDIGNLMAAGEDAGKLFTAYVSPYINGFGASLNGGWYNTAKPHKLGGFDITFSGNLAFIPDAAQSFNVNDVIGTDGLLYADPQSDGITPTVAGGTSPRASMLYKLPGTPLDGEEAFRMPQGTDLPYMIAPTLQVGLGLIKDTEIMGRWMNYSVQGLGVSLWGIGLKHGIKQYIPVLEKVPVLHITLMGGYTKLMSDVALNVDRDDIGLGSQNYATGIDPTDPFPGQEMAIEMSSFTGNLLVSANLPVVCFYGGAGFATTNANLKLNGRYPFPVVENNNVLVGATAEGLVDTEIKNSDGGVTKPRLNIGMRIKMAIVTIHFDYTKADYSVATAGLGISFR